ncbi:MAG: OmpA family protein [Phycisphaerae bacterium]
MRTVLTRVLPGTLLVALTIVAQGCCTEQEQQISALKEANYKLEEQNKDLRSKYSRAQMGQQQQQMELQDARGDLERKEETIEDLRAQLDDQPEPTKRGDGDTATGWERGLVGDKVTVGSDVLFSSGRATLTNKGKETLAKIARQLKGEYQGLPVRVYGYTDSDPIVKTKKLWQDNLDLSANRAMAVTRYLIQQDVDKDRLETVGMGATNFVASNKTKTGKAKNRRVEIIVIRK